MQMQCFNKFGFFLFFVKNFKDLLNRRNKLFTILGLTFVRRRFIILLFIIMKKGW